MDERQRFISDWLKRDWTMSDLCAHYDISRKTGYKWLDRFKAGGAAALIDLPKSSHAHPNETDDVVEAQVLKFRRQHPFWGPRKIKNRLERLQPDVSWPANSTIGSILKRHGLVMTRKRRWRTPLYEGPRAGGLAPNDVWAADFKGWFKTGNGTRIDPLTVTDFASRYLIRCRAVAATDGENVRGQMTAAFQEFGMPKALRTDNGVPFATVGLGGLSKFSVWLIKLGITPERIRPAHPEENGAHERMHRTLKQQTAKPPKADELAQQRAFDHFKDEYNDERPHEALQMKTPADVYRPSPRPFPKRLPEIEYPSGSTVRLVTTNGTINFHTKRIYLTHALIDETVRLEEGIEGWRAWFGPLLLGKLDLKKEEIRRLPTKVLPMPPV